MKNIALIAVAVFEILCGFSGFVMVFGWVVGVTAYDPVPVLWFGIFPIASLIAGVMLLLRTKHSYDLSRIVLLLQIPFIVISGFTVLRVAIALNLYLTATWLGRNGAGPTVLGLNVFAIGMFVLLQWARPVPDHETDPSRSALNPPPPPDFNPEQSTGLVE
jgi:hypothetical protein